MKQILIIWFCIIGHLTHAQRNPLSSIDTIKRIVEDDYPVTNKMLSSALKDPSGEIQSGQLYSSDKAWFRNDTIKQMLIFELYTDYHRMIIYHFYMYDIPADLINNVELHVKYGELASDKQKQQGFDGFRNQAVKINATYFVTEKGLRLGDAKEKAIGVYGAPDKQIIQDGIEKIEWIFIGDNMYDGKADLNGKPLVKNSFGYRVIMYFKNGKLVGQILYNDIP